MAEQTPNDRIVLTREELTEISTDITQRVLLRMGFDTTDPKEIAEIKADQVHLRRWRKAVDQAGKTGIVATVTTLISGLAAVLWLGIQHVFGRA